MEDQLTEPAPESFLPLHPLHFRVLAAVRLEPLHGYRIVKELERKEERPVHPANLYRRIRSLKTDGLIRETDAPTAPLDDRGRKYFELTGLGRTVLAAEIRRLQTLLAEAGASAPALS
jgi:DNA-binding PadR family transcriptional regulator